MSEDIRARLAEYRGRQLQKDKDESPQPQNSSPEQPECENKALPATEGKQHSQSWWSTGLKFLLWLLVWGFFIEVEFGMVYLVVSGLVFIVLSLRGGRKRRPGELSAYSVFNENFEAIEGTLSAEQFEKELRYGPTAVR